MKNLILLTAIAIGLANLANADPVTSITDGANWQAAVSNGPTIKMLLREDGSGTVAFGIIRRSVTWVKIADGLCISNLPRSEGPRCFNVQPVETGYRMLANDGGEILLAR